jgi:predicted TIM-barrel fold metal-dependent hydrolase
MSGFTFRCRQRVPDGEGAPKYYPTAIIDYANTRGADKVMYAGYYPMGISLERTFNEMPNVPFRDHVWPKFLRENAMRVFKLDE